jgi:lipopolysaccharide biosynthesis glycosyltransferase
MNLFTTIDASWLPYACMMIQSVRTHRAGTLRYWIIHEDISPALQEHVTAWGREQDIHITFVDFAARVSADRSGVLGGLTMPMPEYSKSVLWGRYCGRQLLPGLPDDVQRVIYADVDMIAAGDLTPLVELDLAGQSVGAVEYLTAPEAKAAGLEEEPFFNNGLLVFDLDRFDTAGCVQRMQQSMAAGRLPFGPQSAFNHAMRGQVYRIDEQWNVQGNHRVPMGDRAQLIHFTGDTKPWHMLSTDPLRPLVRSVIARTPFPEAWQPDASLAKRLRLVARACKGVFRR